MSLTGSFHDYVLGARTAGHLVVQPRMGFSAIDEMRTGLLATADAARFPIGTLTIDSFTRLRLFGLAEQALATGKRLNGYPIVAHTEGATQDLVSELANLGVPVQVRHGSPIADEVFHATAQCGIGAIEGGPVSYCLPYGRVPLAESIESWRRCAEFWASRPGALLESFAGCMMGQLCPPELLLALGVLEGIFFSDCGVRDVSLSYAQGTNQVQDVAAVKSLNRLAQAYLADDVRYHSVVYTFMGLFPETQAGADAILRDSAYVAAGGGADRLIVKTRDEARRIPSIAENARALSRADCHGVLAKSLSSPVGVEEMAKELEQRARRLIDATLELHPDIGEAIRRAFDAGLLDVPFCFHRDNRNVSRPALASNGELSWSNVGRMPVVATGPCNSSGGFDSRALLDALSYNRRRYDSGRAVGDRSHRENA